MDKLNKFHAVDNGETVYLQIREQLREFVLLQAKPGERLPSQRELAKRFNVAPMTVVRAIMDLQHEGLVQRIPGKGTYAQSATSQPFAPQAAAQMINNDLPFSQMRSTVVPTQLAMQAHIVILTNYRYTGIERPSAIHTINLTVSAVERTVQAAGGRTTIIDRQADTDTDTDIDTDSDIAAKLDDLLNQDIQGIVFVGAHQRQDSTDEEWLKEMQRRMSTFLRRDIHVAVVQLAYDYSPFDVVQFDGEWGALVATQHLLSLGHRHIAFFSPAPGWRWVESRIQGYRRALRLQDETLTPHIITADPIEPVSLEHSDVYWNKVGELCTEQLLAHPEITAVVAANDMVARQVIIRLADAGISVPDDISIVGFDDNVDCRQLRLTTVHPPIDRLGEEAAQLVLQAMDGSQRGIRKVLNLQPTLIVRQSTRSIA